MPICLSTSWNASRYTSGKAIIQEVKALGFCEIELSFNLTPGIIRDIAACVRKKQIRVRSLHNYCPIPKGVSRQEALPDCYSLAALDDEKRRLAVTYTKVTIDTAYTLNAQAVVLHCGRVDIPDRTRELIALYDNGQLESPQAKELKAQMQKERSQRAQAHIQAVLKSLAELEGYARKLHIALGVETRYYYREIPSFDEVEILLNEFKDSNIFYWHDTGHAQLWENLGVLKHKDYFKRYAQYLLGVHLHDIKGADDHRAPLTGDFDFASLRPYLTAATIKTLEAHYPATAREIVQAKCFLEKLYEPN